MQANRSGNGIGLSRYGSQDGDARMATDRVTIHYRSIWSEKTQALLQVSKGAYASSLIGLMAFANRHGGLLKRLYFNL